MHFEDYFLENLRFVNFIQYLNQLLDKFNITFNLCSPKKKKTFGFGNSVEHCRLCFIFYESKLQM